MGRGHCEGTKPRARGQIPALRLSFAALLRAAEQVALAEVDLEIERLDQVALLLDLLDDEIDAGAVERALERRDPGCVLARALQEPGDVELDEAEMPPRQERDIEVEIGYAIEREREAEPCEPHQE